MRFIGANPAAEVTIPKYENHLAERIICEEDVRRMLLATLTPRDKTLLHLLYAAGLRVSEACGLRWRSLCQRGDAGQIAVFGQFILYCQAFSRDEYAPGLARLT
ncbi:MAG: tyrosine-type recombinase/integrase [Acidobacteriia bacterium]|nr:tyrosine-type recombinase/integrase [Terriglobia bacterium]